MNLQPPNPKARPHVVILGAGASRACCPDGDASGRKLPVMPDFARTLGLEPTLRAAGIENPGTNFELLYAQLARCGTHAEVLQELETAVFNYFAELRLPYQPTIYDHLVVSLRPKDVIATFNWDPFLIQAIRRTASVTANHPQIVHLHGNVDLGYCVRHQPTVVGIRGSTCSRCHSDLIDSHLLFPIDQKDYSHPLIDRSWQVVQLALRRCFLLTIFGYGAPASDAKAVELMKDAWGDVESRAMEHTEVVDIRSENDLRERWNAFIHTHHYETHANFYDSTIARFPRRTVEMMTRQIYDAEFIQPFAIPHDAGWWPLQAWAKPLVDQEKSDSSS